MWIVGNVIRAIIGVTNVLFGYMHVLQVKPGPDKKRIAGLYVGVVLCMGINAACRYPIDIRLLSKAFPLLIPLLVFKENKIRNLLLYPGAFVCTSIVGVGISFVVAIVMNQPQAQLSQRLEIAILVESVFPFFVLAALAWYKGSKKMIMLYYSKSIYCSFTLISFLFYLLIGLIQFVGNHNRIPTVQMNILGLLMSLVGMTVLVILIWLTSVVHKKDILLSEKNMLDAYVEGQDKYIQLMFEKDREMRSFRHDVNEHMQVLSTCIEQGKYRDALIHVQRMQEDYHRSELKRYTGIVSVDIILSEKKVRMDKQQIDFRTEISGFRPGEHIDGYDICTLLINVLNNAIEACEQEAIGKRSIELILRQDNGRIYICARNTCSRTITYDRLGRPLTTKTGSDHGFGTRNICGVVDKYQGEVMFYTEKEYFITEIII